MVLKLRDGLASPYYDMTFLWMSFFCLQYFELKILGLSRGLDPPEWYEI